MSVREEFEAWSKAQISGHSSLSVTSRYSHLAPDHLRAAVEGLPARVRHGSWKKRVSRKA